MSHPKIRYISQVKTQTIEAFQKQRLESVELKQAAEMGNRFSRKKKPLPKPQTVNYEVGVLRSAFTWAMERELIPAIPTENVKPLRPEPKRQARILSPSECKVFLKTARQLGKQEARMKVFAYAFKFLLNTGLRSGELCNLTWDDVDLETGLIKIRAKEGWTPKSYAREFFLNDSALAVLKKLGSAEGRIFVNTVGGQLKNDDLRQALLKVAYGSGFDDLTRVHDLRHTFNSLMQMNGVDPATMGKILGHRDIETTMIYTHQTQEHLKRSIGKINIK
jgi:integrase